MKSSRGGVTVDLINFKIKPTYLKKAKVDDNVFARVFEHVCICLLPKYFMIRLSNFTCLQKAITECQGHHQVGTRVTIATP